MSQIVTRRKRRNVSQDITDPPSKEDGVSNSKDCFTSVPDKLENNENKLTCIAEEAGVSNAFKLKISNSKTCREKECSSIILKNDSLIPLKKKKVTDTKILTHRNFNQSNKSPNLGKDICDLSPAYLSIARLEKSSPSFRNSRIDIFNSITGTFNSSKILNLGGSSELNTQKRLELSSWGLPQLILQKYHARGINSMFPWQVECLANKKILENNKNLVYSAPTSAGKTLVAEFLVLKTVLERRKKVIFILPFVSVVREKMFYFQDLLSDSGVRVEGFMGGVAPAGGFASVHIAIATIEKANSLINRLMEENNLTTLGAVVIDELHLLGDSSRGYLLELLLTKLKYMSLSLEDVNIQLIGMSATLPNLPLIADWLDAELYKTEFRPIPLNEQCKIESSICDSKLNVIRQLESAPDIVNDTDNIIQLCIETISGGHGVLIFCPTKNWCEQLSLQMASTFFQLGRDNTPHGQILRKYIELNAVQEVLAQLEHSPVGLDNILKKTVAFGVAFHHAGLTMDERDIIEGGFRVGSIKVLIATSTLSSGVNLPARRVIIRSPMFNGRPLDRLTYQQMIGRAGRMGKDTAGESILICKQNERAAAADLMSSSLEPIVSCLEDSGPLIRALLEAVASQIVRSQIDLNLYCNCTFVYKCEKDEVKKLVEDAIKFLETNEFLLLKKLDGIEQRMVATCLGKACLSASIPPREGLFLFEELQRARKCFVLDTELHVVYLVTPFNSSSQINQIDWMIFMDLWRSLSESERRVGQLVGVEERFLLTAMRGVVKPGKSLNIHRRFFTALALHDLVREMSLNSVCKKYKCCRGLLQSLQQSSSTFAGMVTNFCKELKWDCMELLFAQFQARLQFGVCRDLLDLLRLPSLNGLRARSLFKHGITSVAELAVANEIDVEDALNKALPFESEKDFDGGNEAEIAKKTKMRTVFITGKDGMTAREAAFVIIKEARVLVKNELGVRDVQWSQLDTHNGIGSTSSNASINNQIHLEPPSLLNCLSASNNISPICSQSNFNTRNHHIISLQKAKNNDYKECSVRADEVNIEKPMEVVEKKNDAPIQQIYLEKTDDNLTACENDKRISGASEIHDEDVINESDKPEVSSKILRTMLAEKTKSIVKDHFQISTQDFEDKLEPRIEELSNKNEKAIDCEKNTPKIITRNLRPKIIEKSKNNPADKINSHLEDLQDGVSSKKEKLNKKKNLVKQKEISESLKIQSKFAKTLQVPSGEDQITICTMDFQDELSSKIEQINQQDDRANAKKTSAVSNEDQISVNSLDFQPIDLISTNENSKNDFKKLPTVSKNQVSFCTLDFDSNIDSIIEKLDDKVYNKEKDIMSTENQQNIISTKSSIANECFNQKVVEFTENKDFPFHMPEPISDNKTNNETKRPSNAGNYSKSPSLFSDSSFLDTQMCSFLEKNVIEGSCLVDFEKNSFTQDQKLNKIENIERNKQSRSSDKITTSGNSITNLKSSTPTMEIINNSKKSQINNKNNVHDEENEINKPREVSVSLMPTTWAEDSWDKTKNLFLKDIDNKVTEKNFTSDSPSLLSITRSQSRLRKIVSNQSVLKHVQATSSKEKDLNVPLTNTPKSVMKKRAFDKKVTEGSPIAGFRTYNVSKSILPSTPSSNKSDSEDSIVSSQTISERSSKTNKTRIRIERKILSTQKKFKKMGTKDDLSPKIDRDTTPMLVKQNSEPIFEDSASDIDNNESDTMFDSDDAEKSIEKKNKKITISKPIVQNASVLLRSNNSIEDEPLKLSALEPQNVALSKRSFRLFCNEIFGSSDTNSQRKNLSVAFVTEPNNKDPIISIGNKIVSSEEKKKSKKSDLFVYGCKKISGIIISWSFQAIYYVPFNKTTETKVTIKERIKFVQDVVTNSTISLRCFNAKEIHKIFYACFEVESNCKFLDPKIGDWMINSDFCNKSYTELTAEYFPRGLNLAQNSDNNGTRVQLEIIKASVKAVLSWYITEAILNKMKEQSTVLFTSFKEIEMPTNIILANMELRGFGMNLDALKELSVAIKDDISRIEEKAFKLAGRKFNFNSSKEVSQVLGLSKKGRACTNKKALMSCENPISNLVTLWRKLTTVQIKIIYPLLHFEKKNNRIHGNCITRTVTGRVSMHEPNLQTIPRDFKSDISDCIFSVRMAFIPIEGNIMLSADFCQLELRILAHFSKDPVLCKLMHEQGDIFKNIAARLNNISETMVDDDMRQRAKQLCYAMIYGMGTKSLAESLSVTESEAKDFLETFMRTYKGVKIFLNAVSERARVDGFVSTLSGRRRFLPGLSSKIPAVKAQAERQAVNTKIQGSAADIAKKAMVQIETRLQNEFSSLPIIFPTSQSRRNLRSSDINSRPRGAYLILQLHDELIYEVNCNDLNIVAEIVKQSMEHAFELRVPLPVKIKVGTAWGNLEEYQI